MIRQTLTRLELEEVVSEMAKRDNVMTEIVNEVNPTDEDLDSLEFEYDELEEHDGQPSEYDEWQDYYGGDDWDHGQYDHAEYEWDCDLHNEY